MKKLIGVISIIALVVGVLSVAWLVEKPANAYVSTRMYSPGRVDRETMWVIAGDTITRGMVVSWEQDYNAYTSTLFDTYSVVIRSEDENDSDVAGIALSNANPKQSLQLVIRGEVFCKIDGSDSNDAAAAITRGTILSTADRNGFLGSAQWDSGAGATATGGAPNSQSAAGHTYRTMPVGKLITGTVVTTDTGAITGYTCYVDLRSRF